MSASFPSPQTITRTELSNGIVVLAYENHNSPSVVIGGYLWAGSLSEAAEQAGLSNLTATMLMRGTDSRTFDQINEALESVGAQFGFRSGVHSVGFGGKSLAEDLHLLLGVLSDSLQHPIFPSDETEKVRGQNLTDLQRRAYDTRRMARLTFNELLFPNHPYGRSVQGYEETISGLARDDLSRYYRERYSPQGTVVAIVGAVSPQDALDQVQAALGSWRAPDAVPNRSIPPSVSLAERRRRLAPIPGKTQSDIIIGWPGMTRSDPDFVKANLANTILGTFGMMGRLGDSVRDEQGLAYYVYSRLEAGLGTGPWLAIAGVNPANVERAIDGILGEVRRLCDEPVAGEDLADSQSFLTGTLPLRLETNEGVVSALLDMERYELGLDYLQRYASLVQAVGVQDVQQVAQRYLDPEVYALAVAGPEV